LVGQLQIHQLDDRADGPGQVVLEVTGDGVDHLLDPPARGGRGGQVRLGELRELGAA